MHGILWTRGRKIQGDDIKREWALKDRVRFLERREGDLE